MNKKRVALALAAALGINTLMVTVGQVSGQVQIAHAQNARLIGDEAKKLDGIIIKTLDTTVETVNGNDATLTFKDLTKDNVSDVSGTLTYTKFGERPNTDINSSVNVAWEPNTGKATVKGMNAPGIYSGDVTVTYKDGTKETYRLTLRKTYEKDVLTASIDVGVGTIDVTNVKFGSTPVTPSSNEILELHLNGTKVDTINSLNDTKFTVTGMAEGQVYELVYKKDGNEQGRAQIVLTKQDQATVKAYATNAAGKDDIIGEAIKTDYGVSSVSVISTTSQNGSTYLQDVNTTININGTKVVDYTQTKGKEKSADRFGGAKISTSTSSTTGNILTVNVGGDNVNLLYLHEMVNNKNFLPSHWLKWGPIDANDVTVGKGSSVKNALYGEGKVTIDGETKTLYDASSYITANTTVTTINSTNIGNTAYGILSLSGHINTSTNAVSSNSTIAANDLPVTLTTFDYDTSKLPHGYSSVSVDFTAVQTPFGGKTLSSWASDVNAIPGATKKALPVEGKTDNLPATEYYATQHTTTPVKASIVVAKDSLDGAVVNSTFEKTSASEGKLVLTGGNELLKGTDENTLARKLSVSGSTGISFVEKDTTNGNLVFRVQFNGQVPSTISWTLDKLSGSINVTSVDAVNFDGEVKPSNANTDKLENQFEVSAKFNSVVPTGGSLEVDGRGSTRVTFDQLGDGAHTVSTKVTSGNYQGTYSAGIWVTNQPMGLKITKTESTTSGRVDLTIDGTFFAKDDYKNVTKGTIRYREKGTTNWTTANVTFTVGENSDISTDAQDNKTITKSVTDLTADKEYEFQVIYDYKEGNTTKLVASNIVTQKVSNANNNNNGTITGNGSSSTTTGTSTGSTTITVTTSNSTLTGTSASVTLPSGFRYDSGKNPVAVTFKYKDKDGKIVTETKEQYSNVTARFNGNNVELNGLVPGKDYNEITVDYTDNNGKTRSIILKNVKTTSQTQVETYLANVYEVVFGRPADEAGYHFHLDNLKNKKVSLRDFLLNMLNEKEFVEKYKSTEEKIEALYNAIVNRTSDEAGKKFWVDEYKKVLAVYGSETTALKAIADRMVNENELKELADKMGVQW